MNKHFRVNQVFQTFLVIGVLINFTQSTLAHNSFEHNRVLEGTSLTNHMLIGHGCGGNAGETVIGTSVVFPDGIDSIITIDGNVHEGSLDDFLQGWGGNFRVLQDRAVFDTMDAKRDDNGNVVGLWAGGGPGVLAANNAQIPFRMSGSFFNPDSCAKSVRFAIPVADVCTVTSIADFDSDTVSLWTPAVGSKFDGTQGGGHSTYDSPPFLTLARDLENNPLPESCGEGIEEVVVKPSAAQIDRDMPVRINGQQIWPQN